MKKPGTFAFEEAFPLIARSIQRSWREPKTFVSRLEISKGLLGDPHGRKVIEAAQRARGSNVRLERIAGNMIDWFSQRWTMGERTPKLEDKWKSLFELFTRRRDGPRWAYKPAEDVQEADIIFEGAKIQSTVSVYERSAVARRKCIEHYGTKCYICGFSFGAAYGQEFDKVIHVHHLHSLGEIGQKHKVDPIADLRPVCANCHIVLHTRTPACTIEELQVLLETSRQA